MADVPPAQAHSSVSNNIKSQTARGKQTSASARSKIITRPPWAKDEPPSPTDHNHEPPSPGGSRGPTDARLSDVASNDAPAGPSGEYRWFPFTRRRPMLGSDLFVAEPSSSTVRLEKRSSILRSPSLVTGFARREDRTPALVVGGRIQEQASTSPRALARDRNLRIVMPASPAVPYTLSQSRTPGWDSPWAVKPFESLSRRNIYEEALQNGGTPDDRSPHNNGGNNANDSWWPRTRKRARTYLLNNTYVPLLFRFINITFTAAALGVAIHIRKVEKRTNSTGILGSSPTLVVIFAPLTLIHVMVAIYLEYFGRPLGLWRTSAKLAHTLLEVLFICAWSAALSLCFDNFFTSPIPCADESSISWYSNIPRPPSPVTDKHVGETLCDNQLALIILVGIGLLMYCFNLVISLYRIFERVKNHQTPVWGGSSTRA